eukprot:Sdes_comp19280_c0_seq1m10294
MCSFVFTEKVKAFKGSDASWKYDEEPPEDELEFSDDEDERKIRNELKKKLKNSRREKRLKNDEPVLTNRSIILGKSVLSDSSFEKNPLFDIYGNPIIDQEKISNLYSPNQRPSFLT